MLDVLVPAHDEERLLLLCLAALLPAARSVDIRVVVIDNGCTDRTAQIARSWRDDFEQAGVKLEVLETTGMRTVLRPACGSRARGRWPSWTVTRCYCRGRSRPWPMLWTPTGRCWPRRRR